MEQLLQPATPDQIMIIYIHGNRVGSSQAVSEGRYVYHLLTSGMDDPVSVRYVIWSWPSARIHGQLRDVRIKAERTEIGGYCVGWFLSQLPEDQRIGILGYSFGARIATGALHLLGGGQLSCRRLPTDPTTDPHYRVVMLAAALQNRWLHPGCYHENALPQIDLLLNLYNSCDPVLKRYPLLEKRSNTPAMGFTGMQTSCLGPLKLRVEQCDARRVVGKTHAAIGYFRSPQLCNRIKDALFWHTPTGQFVTHQQVSASESAL